MLRLQVYDFFITRRCNLKCGFCYVKDKEQGKSSDEVERNIRTFKLLVENYRKNIPSDVPKQYRRLELELYGGEPTLAWDSVEAIVALAKEVKDIAVVFKIVSNMVEMDEIKIKFCNDNRIDIRPSVDGCKKAMDAHRIRPDGSSVADIVYKNAKFLLNSVAPYKVCRSSISPETCDYMFESVKFLADLGFLGISQTIVSGVEWNLEKLEIVRQQVALISEWWVEEMKKGRHIEIFNLTVLLHGIWTDRYSQRPCTSGLVCGAVDLDGSIYPCHRFCNKSTPSEYKMGTIYGGITNTDLIDKLSRFDWVKYRREHCVSCIAIKSCRGVCLHDSMLNGKEPYTPTETYCSVTKMYMEQALRVHEMLKDNSTYLSAYKPRILEGSTNQRKI